MKILLTGPQWAGGDLMNSIAVGFSDIGHETQIFCDHKKNFYSYPRKLFKILNVRRYYNFYYDKYREKLGKNFYDLVDHWRPDLIIAVNGHNFIPEVILKIRKNLGIPFATWLVDDVSNWPDTPLLSYLYAYSHIFVGDEAWISPLKLIRIDQPIFCVPQGGDPHIFKPTKSEKMYDLSLIGNFLPNDPLFGISFLRVNILNFLSESGFHLKIIGMGAAGILKFFPNLEKSDIQDGSISDQQLNEVYNQSKISISLMAPQYRNDFSARVFNAALAEGFQLVDYKNNINKYFPSGEVPSFQDLKALKKLAVFYLNNDSERVRLAKLSRRTALKFHTWAHRAKKLLDFLND